MSWMKMHKVVLNIAGQLVHINSPVYGTVILHVHVISRIKASLRHVVELKLEEIHVVREFTDMNERLGSRLSYSLVQLL
jgi:hypothetical protein